MNDSYDGVETNETTTESSTETSAESGSGEVIADAPVSNSEVSSAFDEGDEEPTTEVTTTTEEERTTEVDTVSNGSGKIEDPKVEDPKIEDTKVENVNTEKPTDASIETQEAPEHVKCINEAYAGKEHPETGVPFETKIVEVNGKQLEVTVPQFESKFDTQLEPEQYQLSRAKHDAICNAKLKEAVEADPDWAESTFTPDQLDQIKAGYGVDGYTWHHDGGEVGRMQLVDSGIHEDTRHTGGVAIWGYKSPYV